MLNSVIYVIRRVGGRDRRVVRVDRLQRYVEAAPHGVVLASQPRPNWKDLLSRLRRVAVVQPISSHLQG